MERRIEVLERRLRALSIAFIITVAGFAVVNLRAQSGVNEHLRVRRITVVDEKGTERVWIAAPVPDPIVQGRRGKRSAPISGVVLLDAKGNERGSFVTSDRSGEVFVSLDSEKEQETLFLVNPGGGGHLSIYDTNDNLARIGVLAGRPTLFLSEKGQVVLEQPPTKIP